MESKKTLVVGASENTERYSNICIHKLNHFHQPVVALGLRSGVVDGIKILTGKPALEVIHTITMYVGPQNQNELIDYLLSLKPQRIIFNPGSENNIFKTKAEEQGIETVEACSLVMLTIGAY